MALSLIPHPLPPDGFPVPIDRIDSAFRLLGFLPGYSHNDLTCRLVLHETHWEIKILTTQQHSYPAIKQVDFRPESFWSRARVLLSVQPDHLEYIIKPSSGAVARALLRFCLERGLPLTPAARQEALAS
ncbi:hypothetical protein [Hymenobacter canadensis]|uniref:Uncharacterized protein n=1 Tax=Hymenobacter canadensis TaxID=2999067 RepID=A0ABY7LPU4_9BACT|nr:hypothetical protein [Hymenobacter canadensis]WBA41491.1 hypothetical protein O3303_16950 [Hymenobacter canadensis]